MPETRAQQAARRARGGRRTRTPARGASPPPPGRRASPPPPGRRSRTRSRSTRSPTGILNAGRGRGRFRLPLSSASPSPPPSVRARTRTPARRGRTRSRHERSRSRGRRSASRRPARPRGRRSTSRRPSRPRGRGSPSRRPSRGSPPRQQTRSGTRSRRSRSPSPRTLKRKLLEVEEVKKKLQKMAEQKKEKDWSNAGIKKQAEWAIEVRDYNEELQSRLQAEFGEFSSSLTEFVNAGEKRVHDRIHLLRIADKFGWAGANDFVEEELARDEKEEKKLKGIRKEFEAKKEKKGQGSGKGKNFPYKKQVDNYKDTRYDIEFFCEGAGDHHNSSGSKIPKGQKTVSSVVDPAISHVTVATSAMSGPEGAEIRGKEEEDEADEALEDEEALEEDRNFISCKNTMKYSNNRNSNPEFVNDRHNLDLDDLEGITIDLEHDDYIDGLTGTADNTDETTTRVVDALRGKTHVWSELGAGAMVTNIISKGLRLNFNKILPTQYREPNNKSFKQNIDFGTGEVFKLLKNGVIEEVAKKELTCINPLSVASNKKGKLRLCLDLSRKVNLACEAKKFKIESISDFMKVVRKGAWVVFYDLKSAFHHVEVIPKHRRFLGLTIKEKGVDRFFRFKAMPFGYKDASRILTKIMRIPVNKWRTEGIANYIHIDDGLAFCNTEQECVQAAKVIQDDLESLGLVTSPEKCCWKPTQTFTWCGFDWDTKQFTVAVTKDKKDRIKGIARELLGKDRVTVKDMASLTGLIISCGLAIGRSARFHTRSSVRWIQDGVDYQGWGASGVLPRRVRDELWFWVKRIADFECQSIRKAARILRYYVCSDGGKWYVGGRVAKDGTELVEKRFQHPLEDWEAEESSTFRELRSMEVGLTLIGPEAAGCVLRYGNDNYAAVRAAAFGSTKERCHEVAKRINDLCDEYGITLEVVWRRRNTEEIVLCDKLSKTFDLGEYRLEKFSFWALEQEFGPWEVDWFASAWSQRLPRFAARFWTVGAAWTDAFTQDWGDYVGFFHPPLDQLAACLEKISVERPRGVLLVPDWPGSEADSLMIQARDRVELLGVRYVEFESPTWREDNTFRGWAQFGLRVYGLNGRR